MYLFAELQKIPFLLQLSVGKIGHLILKELISIRESKSNYSNVMATHGSTVMLSPSPHCRPPFEIKRKKNHHFGSILALRHPGEVLPMVPGLLDLGEHVQ